MISAQSADMQAIAKALGVECNYCHTERGGRPVDAGSDFEKSRVLREIVAGQSLDAVSRAALLNTAGHIGSDHKRGQVLSALLQGGAVQ